MDVVNRVKQSGFIKASFDPAFYAYWIFEFAQEHKLSWSDTLYVFQTSQDRLFSLGLCKISDDPQRIRQVAEYTKIPTLVHPSFQSLFFGFHAQSTGSKEKM